MRGKANFRLWFSAVRGITPACAGKRDANGNPCDCGRDHPRVCGEKFFCRSLAAVTRGSPPRVRGKVTLLYALADKERITPACAGKSTAEPRLRITTGDHPRVCGEKCHSLFLAASAEGSPPRVRGKAFDAGKLIPVYGITPACAGKSVCVAHTVAAFRDHPRVCGEKTLSRTTGAAQWGSPPRVRGKALMRDISTEGFRITPACAGKSPRDTRDYFV